MFTLLDWPNNRLVEALGNAPRAGVAYRELLRRGAPAGSAIRRGLHHADAAVREQCCRLLDQLLVEDAFGEMVAMLEDVDAGVRVAAVHALACDRCKPDGCRPEEAAALGPGIRLLEEDSDPHVRAMAVELVGRFVHGNADAVEALVRVAECDPSPAVRKKARWYSPGGPIFRRTAPRPGRAQADAFV
jgi:HEAT repeat protein